MPEVRDYWFPCQCGRGCERRSESLRSDYGRLSSNLIWVHKVCLKEGMPEGHIKLRPFKGGYILEEVDF